MKKVILAFLILIATVIAFGIYQKQSEPSVKIKNHSFKLLIAKTENDKQTGLSKYNNLPQDEAMVFIFDNENIYPFWMKNMKFPIDIIFIRQNKIVTIYKNVPSPKASGEDLPIYSPSEPVDKVLEANSGVSQKDGFKVGDKVEFSNLK